MGLEMENLVSNGSLGFTRLIVSPAIMTHERICTSVISCLFPDSVRIDLLPHSLAPNDQGSGLNKKLLGIT
jgi:hypothetical protein